MIKYIALSANLKIDYFYTKTSKQFKTRSIGYIELIDYLKPDFIGFQEYQSQAEESLSLLDSYYQHFSYECGNKLTKQRNAIYFLKENYKLIDNGVYWLSNALNVEYSRFFICEPRNIVWANLLDKRNNSRIFLASTHLDFSNPITRIFQLNTINEILKKRSEDTFILLGDFNATHISPEIQSFLKKNTLKDAMASFKNPTIEFPSLFPKHSGPIDHIFLSNNVEILSSKIYPNKKQDIVFSDHHPISCLFTLD